MAMAASKVMVDTEATANYDYSGGYGGYGGGYDYSKHWLSLGFPPRPRQVLVNARAQVPFSALFLPP